MYCDEHGTADYCGECMTEAQDQEIAALRQHAEAMAAALSGLADLANHFNVSGVYFTEDIRNREALELAESALTAYRAESAKGGV